MTIELNEITITAGQRSICDHLSAQFNDSVIVVVGGVGSGKSTFARALAGERFKDTGLLISGTVTLGADRLDLGCPTNGKRIGYIPQIASAFFMAPTVGHEIFSVAYCNAEGEAEARRIVESWEVASPLARHSGLAPFVLSGGQQRMLMLELVLASEPDHLVIDGADTAFDARFRQRGEGLIRRWLAGSADRRLVIFSNGDEGGVCYPSKNKIVLPGRPVPMCALRPPEFKRGNEVVSFHDISAGPQIGSRRLLQKLNLTVCEGEFVALRGPNGVGKSTLLRLLAGIDRPQAGEIRFNGIPLDNIDWPGLAGGIAFLHQEPELSGSALLGNLFTSQRKVMQNHPWATGYLNSWDGSVGGYWSLSSGERAIATLLTQIQAEPSLWVLDEPSTRIPTGVLTQIIAEGRLKAPKLAGLVVSHDDELIAATCERSVYLGDQGIKEGNIVHKNPLSPFATETDPH